MCSPYRVGGGGRTTEKWGSCDAVKLFLVLYAGISAPPLSSCFGATGIVTFHAKNIHTSNASVIAASQHIIQTTAHHIFLRLHALI